MRVFGTPQPIPVKRDCDRRVTHERRKRLRVHTHPDHQRRERGRASWVSVPLGLPTGVLPGFSRQRENRPATTQRQQLFEDEAEPQAVAAPPQHVPRGMPARTALAPRDTTRRPEASRTRPASARSRATTARTPPCYRPSARRYVDRPAVRLQLSNHHSVRQLARPSDPTWLTMSSLWPQRTRAEARPIGSVMPRLPST